VNVRGTESAEDYPWVRTFRRKLYCAAKRNANRRFGILYDKVVRKDVLTEAWCGVSGNQGSAGVDGQSIEWIVKEYGVGRFLQDIQDELVEQRYRPSLIRRTYIPKADGKQRPLGIPTVKDRVVQMAVKLIIEPLFEADFLECSYGFRPKRSNQQAAELVHRHVNHRKWVVDLDLQGYFDTIPHDRLMACVRRRVTDRRILYLIRSWLKAGVLDEGRVVCPEKGTPQGGVLSPLLSNIYLHEFDRQWSDQNGKLIRFADDMVILCRSEDQAQRALAQAEALLTDLDLTLNREKTKLTHVRDSFDFLGFTYREAYSSRQQRDVRLKVPSVKGLKSFRQRLKARLQHLRLGAPLLEAVAAVNGMLRGWANYFRIGNSYAAASSLQRYAYQQLRLYWRRRKQRKDIAGTQKWPDSFFHDLGVHYVPTLVR